MKQKFLEEIKIIACHADLIPRTKIFQWMECDDVEVLYLLVSYINIKEFYLRVRPYLSIDDYHAIYLKYFGLAIQSNQLRKEWPHSTYKYEASSSAVNWFREIWRSKDDRQDLILGFKNWIENLYKNSDENSRKCIITSMLEYLFEDKEVLLFFSDWEEDSVLFLAYDEAMRYADVLRQEKNVKDEVNDEIDPFINYFRFYLKNDEVTMSNDSGFKGQGTIRWPFGDYEDDVACALVGWFACVYQQKDVYKELLVEFEQWFKDLYIQGDKKTKEFIENKVLKRLLENRDTAPFFANW